MKLTKEDRKEIRIVGNRFLIFALILACVVVGCLIYK
jgi:hypothetical protein